jgi:hypothetical protein
LRFDPSLDVGGSISAFSIREFHFIAGGTADLNLDVEAEVSITGELKPGRQFTLAQKQFDYPVGRVDLPFYGTIGVVPVAGTVRFDVRLSCEIEGGILGKVSGGIRGRNEISLGARYSNSAWEAVSESSRSFEPLPTEWAIVARAEARCAVRPEVILILYGVEGPFVGFEPYLELSGTASNTSWDAQLIGGMDFLIGMRVKVLSFALAEWNQEIRGEPIVLKQWSGNNPNPPATQPPPSPPPPTSNRSPIATISRPTPGAYSQGTPIGFPGSANDPEEGSLTGGSLVWSSNVNGQIGTGTGFSRADLSIGTHTITLTATDSKGAIGRATVVLTIQGNQPPADDTAFFDDFNDGNFTSNPKWLLGESVFEGTPIRRVRSGAVSLGINVTNPRASGFVSLFTGIPNVEVDQNTAVSFDVMLARADPPFCENDGKSGPAAVIIAGENSRGENYNVVFAFNNRGISGVKYGNASSGDQGIVFVIDGSSKTNEWNRNVTYRVKQYMPDAVTLHFIQIMAYFCASTEILYDNIRVSR